MRKYRAAAAVIAAVMLSGCTITPTAEKKLKPVPREYEDSVAEVVYAKVGAEYDDTEPEFGAPLVYRDFCVGEDKDYIKKFFEEKDSLYNYSYWDSYDENGEWHRYPAFMARMHGNDTKQEILEEYGVEAKPYTIIEDKLYFYAFVTDDKTFKLNAELCDSCCEIDLAVNGHSAPFEERASIKLYFSGDDLTMAVFAKNYDTMMLTQIDWKRMIDHEYLAAMMPYLPEGERLIPRVMLKGMSGYNRLRTYLDYPVFDFENGYVNIQWYDYDGNTTEGEGILKSGLRLKYELTDSGIELELPEGGDSMATYISYNKYLGAYELHDPYWRDNYGCTLMLSPAIQKKDG